MKNWNIQLFELNYCSKEQDAVLETLKSGWITSGPKTSEFEAAFEKFTDSSYRAVAVSSCTAALHLSLLAADISRGDEVIISALTFVAAANVVKHVGAKVILADSKSETDWNISLDNIRAVVTEKTKAIIIVHFAGKPCDEIEEISEYCREKSIILIEDVAHAPGAGIRGKQCGTYGDFGCFSFFTNKNISVGEGGLVLCRSEENHARVSRLRSHGMTVGTLERYKGRALSYDVSEPGLNYRLDEMRAAIGLVQLEKFPAAQKQRKLLVNLYSELLRDCKILIPYDFEVNPHSTAAYHIFPILLSPRVDRLKFMQHLKLLGIQTSIHYPSISAFKGLKAHVSGKDLITRKISEREVTLPLHTNMKKRDIIYICKSIKEYEDV
ncbi:DegT/DnrJ/EryC1/StrS family aminotransferase [Planktomarina temperata]|nr:DegT/DnrJ/EryC1/StrS family aminotransferase [Planktomarina temperata]